LSIAAVLAFIGVAAWPIPLLLSGQKYDVAITALGEKNPNSVSIEVWIVGTPDRINQSALVRSRSTPLGWEQRDTGPFTGLRGQTMVSYRDQPSTVTFRGVLDPTDEFLLGRHHWSGKARVTVNGVSREYDLYAPSQIAPLAVRLTDFPAGETVRMRPNRVFATWFAVWTLILTAFFLAIPKLLRQLQSQQPLRSGLRDTATFAIPSLIVFGFVLAGTWPAQMSPDSVSQWIELHTGAFTNAHPVIDTILAGGPGRLLGSIGWSMIFQIVELAAAIGFLCRELSCWSINRKLVWAAAIVTPMWPAVALLSTVFWKDIPYSIMLCVLTTLILMLIRTDGEIVRRRWLYPALAITLFLAATLRHNGIVVTAGAVVLIAITYHSLLRAKGIAILLSAGVVLPLLWSIVVIPAAGIPGIGRQYGGMVPMHFLAATVAEGRQISPETAAKMDAILPLEEWKKNYNCLSVVPLFWAPNIHYERLDASLAGPALREAIAHPWTALRHFACMNSLNWRLSNPFNTSYALYPIGIWDDGTGTFAWTVKPDPNPAIRAGINRVVQFTAASPWHYAVFWRPATMMLALFVVAAMASLQGMRPVLLLALSPVILNVLSLVPVIGSQDFRYDYPTVLIGPLLIVFFAGICSLRRPGVQSAVSPVAANT